MVICSGRLNFMHAIKVVQKHLLNDPKENKDRNLSFMLFFSGYHIYFSVLLYRYFSKYFFFYEDSVKTLEGKKESLFLN